jgi:ABC-type transporter Mla subunit MlaD
VTWVRLPVPGPRDVVDVLERAAAAVEQMLAAVPRVLPLLAETERLLTRVNELVDRIEETRAAADDVVQRTDTVVTEAQQLLGGTTRLMDRLTPLLDRAEPSLTRLQPTLERLAETTDPREVDALVMLVDLLPNLAARMQTDVMPVLDSLGTVAPDLHDLLDVSRELNEMLAKIPGMGRVKERIDEEQEAERRG